jgi:ribosomal protein L3 glutamine methyltransferase
LKVSGLLRKTARDFSRAKLHYGHGTRNATEEAAWLISSVLGFLLEQEIEPRQLKKIEALARRRIRERIPLAYLLKQAWLGEHAFYVDERALVPRSFIAELLREHLRPWLAKEPRRALDLCTGSGCLAVLMALEFRRAKVDAADLSPSALEVARTNIRKYRLGRRVRAIRSNLFGSLQDRKYDLIVCNPPYVTARSMRALPEEFRREPALALAAGDDGLDFVRRLLAQAGKHLNTGGLLVCEIGGNRRALQRAYPAAEFAWPETSDPGTVFILSDLACRGARMAAPPRTRATRARARR